MPKIEVEIGDDGAIGTLPDELQKFLDKKINRAYSDGADKALKALKENAKPDPVEVERAKTLEIEVSKLKEAEAIREKRYEDAQAEAKKRHDAELAEKAAALEAKDAEVKRRTDRINELARKEIRAVALAQGARKESLDELELILGSSIGLDDALQVFVKDTQDAGKGRLDKDGKAVTIEGFVAQYLTDHPHHKSAATGRGGGASGGRSLSGASLTGVEAEKAAVLDEVAKNPTVANIARAFAQAGKRGA